MNAHCRIGKMRLKAAPNVTVLPSAVKRRDEAERLLSHARETVAALNDISGYVMIAWQPDGVSCIGWSHGEKQPFPLELLPTYAAEQLRQELAVYEARRRDV